MRTHSAQRTAVTTRRHDFVDITDEVQEVLAASGIEGGQVTILATESSCSLVVNERESGLFADLGRTMDRLGPPGRLVGSPSVVLPAAGGRLQLGEWQRVLLVELDAGPSRRSVVVQVVGE